MLSNDARTELEKRICALSAHADYCDAQVAELLEEIEGYKATATMDRNLAREFQRLLD